MWCPQEEKGQFSQSLAQLSPNALQKYQAFQTPFQQSINHKWTMDHPLTDCLYFSCLVLDLSPIGNVAHEVQENHTEHPDVRRQVGI